MLYTLSLLTWFFQQNRWQLHNYLFQNFQRFSKRSVQNVQRCSTPTHMSKQNQFYSKKNFTVKSVKGMFCFDSIIACRYNCWLKNICNSTCWQLNFTAVMLSRLFKNNKLNETSKTWELISYTHSPPTNCASYFFENRQCNLLKLSRAAVQSLHFVGEPDQS